MDADTFVTTMVELRRAAATADSLAFAAARDSILDEHGVGEAELERFVDRASDDPERMAELWQRIQEVLAPPVDSAAADSVSVTDSVTSGRDTAATD